MAKRQMKQEPGSLLFWLLVASLVIVMIPYGFMGQSEPRLWNLPLWFHVSLLATAAVAGLSAWRIWKFWHLDDDDE